MEKNDLNGITTEYPRILKEITLHSFRGVKYLQLCK